MRESGIFPSKNACALSIENIITSAKGNVKFVVRDESAV